MARFWRFKSDKFEGEFFYVDPSKIVGVSHESKYDDEDKDCFVITLEGGDEYWVHDPDDARRLMAWAETQSEEIPVTMPRPMEWR